MDFSALISEYWIFLLCAFVSAVFATLAGFGSSTLMVPVAMFFMDIKTAVFLVACFHLFNNLFKVKLFFTSIDFKLFKSFGIASILFAFVGARLITTLPSDILKIVVAVFLIAFAMYSFLKPSFKIAYTNINSFIGGALSGFLAGLIGLGGAVRGMFLLSFGIKKEAYIATSALIAFVVDLTRIPTYISMNIVEDAGYYRLLPFLFIIGLVGVRVGKSLLTRINQELFHKIVLTAVFAIGVKLLFTA